MESKRIHLQARRLWDTRRQVNRGVIHSRLLRRMQHTQRTHRCHRIRSLIHQDTRQDTHHSNTRQRNMRLIRQCNIRRSR